MRHQSIIEQRPEVLVRTLRASNEQLQRDFLNVVKILSSLIDMRFATTAGHGRRCAELSERAAVQMNLPATECTQIRFAALLHSLGKMTLNDAILAKKPRDMTSIELAQWQNYPGLSEEMLMGLQQFTLATKVIRSHQERWDGTGFPDRLSGTQIPVGARILAAAIQMDRLRQGWDCDRMLQAEEVDAHLRRQQGKRLCPEACEALIVSQLGSRAPGHGTAKASRKPASEVCIRVSELRAGSTLSRDLVGARGLLLLGANYKITDTVLETLERYQVRHGAQLLAWIKVEVVTE